MTCPDRSICTICVLRSNGLAAEGHSRTGRRCAPNLPLGDVALTPIKIMKHQKHRISRDSSAAGLDVLIHVAPQFRVRAMKRSPMTSAATISLEWRNIGRTQAAMTYAEIKAYAGSSNTTRQSLPLPELRTAPRKLTSRPTASLRRRQRAPSLPMQDRWP